MIIAIDIINITLKKEIFLPKNNLVYKTTKQNTIALNLNVANDNINAIYTHFLFLS